MTRQVKYYDRQEDAQTIADLYRIAIRHEDKGWTVVILDSKGYIDAVLMEDGRWNGSTRFL